MIEKSISSVCVDVPDGYTKHNLLTKYRYITSVLLDLSRMMVAFALALAPSTDLSCLPFLFESRGRQAGGRLVGRDRGMDDRESEGGNVFPKRRYPPEPRVSRTVRYLLVDHTASMCKA